MSDLQTVLVKGISGQVLGIVEVTSRGLSCGFVIGCSGKGLTSEDLVNKYERVCRKDGEC